MSTYERISQFVVDGKEDDVINEINNALKAGEDATNIINKGLLEGMAIVGEKFAKSEMFVPEVLMASRSMNAGMDIVKPLISDSEIHNLGTVVIGTVKGDLHDIGKNLVVMMLESAGFKVVNLGVDTAKEEFVEKAKENNADIVAMSAMLTTTMAHMEDIIKACQDAGIEAKYMVGGAPLTPAYAERINAIYSADASTAALKAKEII
ncbi:MAG: cobalamin-binding protein [Eubacteriaceae bacterium]|jgi:5-methyltetrahydrofolate--homocysteine methyltransferase|nr:cobalamin-binding protein [Eubacteriaceae bacterium]